MESRVYEKCKLHVSKKIVRNRSWACRTVYFSPAVCGLKPLLLLPAAVDECALDKLPIRTKRAKKKTARE